MNALMEFDWTTVITMLYATIMKVHLIALVILGTQAMEVFVKVSSITSDNAK